MAYATSFLSMKAPILVYLLMASILLVSSERNVVFLALNDDELQATLQSSLISRVGSIVLCDEVTSQYEIYVHMKETCLTAFQFRSSHQRHILAYPSATSHSGGDFDGYIYSNRPGTRRCMKHCTRIPLYTPLSCPFQKTHHTSRVGLFGVTTLPDLRVPAQDIVVYQKDMHLCDFFSRISALIIWKPYASTPISMESLQNTYIQAALHKIPVIGHVAIEGLRQYGDALLCGEAKCMNRLLQSVHSGSRRREYMQLEQLIQTDINEDVNIERYLALFAAVYRTKDTHIHATAYASTQLKIPQHDISFTLFGSAAKSVTEAEYTKQQGCSFVADDLPNQRADCAIEKDEHLLVKRYVLPSDSVLELGARYGTTSCALAAATENSGRVVSVEPDSNAWTSLVENRLSHRCNFYFVKSPIGNRGVTISKGNYDTRAIVNTRDASRNNNAMSAGHDHYTYSDIQSVVGFHFTVLLIDCEGCIEYLFEGNDVSLRELLQNVRVILLEADMPRGGDSPCKVNCVDYSKWENMLSEAGFRVDSKIVDKRFRFIYHYAFVRNGG